MPTAVAILRMTNKDRKFYRILGPFLSRRAIVKELGAPVWDDDDKEWFVALDKRRFTVLGFSALSIRGDRAHIASTWTQPDKRGQGVATALTEKQISAIPEGVKTVTVIATLAGAPLYKKAGFKATGKLGRFSAMKLAHA